MPNEEVNIKDYTKELGIFILMNMIIYLFFAFGSIFIINSMNIYAVPLITSGLLLSILAFLAILLDGLLPAKFKYQLVFWKRENFYPGCSIFTNLNDNDLRIDKSKLIEKYGELPTDPAAQNRLWYKMYLKNQYVTKILQSQRSFLFFRDLNGLSFVIIFLGPVLTYVSQEVYNITFKFWLLYISFLVIQYILVDIAARNCGNRFAENVLAEASNSD